MSVATTNDINDPSGKYGQGTTDKTRDPPGAHPRTCPPAELAGANHDWGRGELNPRRRQEPRCARSLRDGLTAALDPGLLPRTGENAMRPPVSVTGSSPGGRGPSLRTAA